MSVHKGFDSIEEYSCGLLSVELEDALSVWLCNSADVDSSKGAQ